MNGRFSHLSGAVRLFCAFAGAVYSTVSPAVTHEQWERKDRPAILRTFTEQMYGVRPVERPAALRFERRSPDEPYGDGLGARRRMKVVYGGPGGEGEIVFTAFLPLAKKPVPAFLLIAQYDPDTIMRILGHGRGARMPVDFLLRSGFAAVAFDSNGAAQDDPSNMTNGVFRVYGPQPRTETSWGALSAWAWGASRIMDWIETQPEIDSRHVAVCGLSRCGKAALVAGATDERFALTCEACSGCGGAKLNRMDLPKSEHIEQITRACPHWFARAFDVFRGRDRELPFDQHQLLQLIAPRLLVVSSATEDDWAGQPGEFESARLASPAWELYGLKGLVAPTGYPAPDVLLQEGCVAYHLRTGIHDQALFDWQAYVAFARRHGW